MQSFKEVLNDMLVTVYHKILRVEEDFLQKGVGAGLTIREMHMIEYIGRAGKNGRTLSEIAEFLEVARPSVTVSVRKLEQKGFLTRNGSAQDGRVVLITLTREGRKVFMLHMHFHMIMVNELESELCEEEKNVLIRVITKLDKFFEKSIEATT
ncbi:MAG: MarR family transcriptional regulator [Oscillospiraceae bacterium]|nr:MarR family transcriptional regulator [Oscillospiraceae bacterium]